MNWFVLAIGIACIVAGAFAVVFMSRPKPRQKSIHNHTQVREVVGHTVKVATPPSLRLSKGRAGK